MLIIGGGRFKDVIRDAVRAAQADEQSADKLRKKIVDMEIEAAKKK